MPRRRDYAAERARRERRYKDRGWRSYAQYRYWNARLEANDRALVRQLAEQIGGPVEADRPTSLMSRRANEIVNPPPPALRVFDWQVRLLQAAGRL